jgi:hypothetical protein
MLYRSFPLPLALCLAIVSAVAWFILRNRCFGWKRYVLIIGYVCAIAMFSFAFLEIAARMLFPNVPQPGDISRPNAEYVFLPNPGGTATVVFSVSPTEYRRVPHVLSAQGFRDRVFGPKAPDEFRILMLGDSYTQGNPVATEDTVPKQLETLLAKEAPGKKISVVNGGCGGAGPLQELGILREKSGKRQRAYNPVWQRTLQRLLPGNQLPFRLERFVRRHSKLYCVFAKSADWDWVAWCFHQCRLYPRFEMKPLPPNEDRPFILETDLKEWYPELDEGMGLLEKYVGQMRDECRSRNIGFIAYCIPDYNELGDAVWQNWQAKYPGLYERWKGVDRTEAFLAREQIPVVKMREPLHAYPRTEDIFFTLDGHLNERGNQLVARLLADYLLQNISMVRGR